jgi:outer membrane protein OmpA-like peptidoglycan-associated protein
MKTLLRSVAVALCLSSVAFAGPFDVLKSKEAQQLQKRAGDTAANKLNASVAKKVNAKLLSESRKNQCSFKVDSDQLAPGCDAKAKRLANALVSAKKTLDHAGLRNYKFVVTGHTDTSGNAAHNKALSQKRAEAIVNQLVAKGVKRGELEAVGMGAEHPLVKPDNTPAKKAKNRRYELQVRF